MSLISQARAAFFIRLGALTIFVRPLHGSDEMWSRSSLGSTLFCRLVYRDSGSQAMAPLLTSRTSTAPFQTVLTAHGSELNDLLPATARDKKHDLFVPSLPAQDLLFLENELSVERLNAIHASLWVAGRPMPARHLGYQLVLSREILLTEEMGLHLVWGSKGIYIKPLPKFLLAQDFWAANLAARSTDTPELGALRQKLNACARGFLYSYCSLISYESDFDLAKAFKLLPRDIEWIDWRKWVDEVLAHCPYSTLNPRFWYGELRLGRLNKIYRFKKGQIVGGYSRVGLPSTYSELLRDNFGILAAILGYAVIVLAAMQVGLATIHLGASSAFQNASWGFTVFSIVAPLAAVGVILLVLIVMMLWNWDATLSFEKMRSDSIGTSPRTE